MMKVVEHIVSKIRTGVLKGEERGYLFLFNSRSIGVSCAAM
jgi:hypothetical protein